MTEKFIVLDTETTNSIDDPIVYDLGWAVVDATGKVYQTYSFVVADVFLDADARKNYYYNYSDYGGKHDFLYGKCLTLFLIRISHSKKI